MGWKLSDIPGPHNRDVEQATAAPGEKRNVGCDHNVLVREEDVPQWICDYCDAAFRVVATR